MRQEGFKFCLDTRTNGALPSDPAYPECLSIQSLASLPYKHIYADFLKYPASLFWQILAMVTKKIRKEINKMYIYSKIAKYF
jgi:hypothetical protein